MYTVTVVFVHKDKRTYDLRAVLLEKGAKLLKIGNPEEIFLLFSFITLKIKPIQSLIYNYSIQLKRTVSNNILQNAIYRFHKLAFLHIL